jgi:hypothetical protein
MNNKTKQQLTKALRVLPKTYLVMPHAKWNKIWDKFHDLMACKEWEFKGGKQSISISLNYGCVVQTGMPLAYQDPPVRFAGVYITIWHPDASWTSDSHVCLPWSGVDTIMRAIDKLSRGVRKLCPHSKAKEIRGLGNCLHLLRCPDCGKEFEVDSSG